MSMLHPSHPQKRMSQGAPDEDADAENANHAQEVWMY